MVLAHGVLLHRLLLHPGYLCVSEQSAALYWGEEGGELTHHDGRRSTAAADTCLLAQAQHYAALPTLSVSQICVVNEFTLVLGDCAAAAGLLCSAKAAGALPAAARSRALSAPPPCDASPADVKLLRAQRAAAACSFLTSRSSRAVCRSKMRNAVNTRADL